MSKSNKKLYISLVSIIAIVATLFVYQFFSYKLLVKNFITFFDNSNYSEANNVIITAGNINPFKALLLENDLQDYFDNKLNSISTSLGKNEVSLDDALLVSKEIYRYKMSTIDDTTLFANYKNQYVTEGINYYNSKEYSKAYEAFNKVNSSDLRYDEAQNYIKLCKENLKADILLQVDSLAKEHYYSKSISLIEDNKAILGNDDDLDKKISELKTSRDEYLAQTSNDSTAASTNNITEITTVNINELNLESDTSFLIHIDKKKSTAFIYKGNKNNWLLNKSYVINVNDSNSSKSDGSYTIQDVNDWFYSILSESDYNWITDNIPSKTKVIVK